MKLHPEMRFSRRVGARRNAFTLIEVLIAIAIVLVLAGVGSIFVFGYLEDAKKNRATIDIQNLTQRAKEYEAKCGERPQTLDNLLSPPNGMKPLIDSATALIDPWGQQYQYDPQGSRNNGLKPDIWTTTQDGETIGNWPGGS
jgi:general secretion pathway protein G